jgi:hypothetical protein
LSKTRENIVAPLGKTMQVLAEIEANYSGGVGSQEEARLIAFQLASGRAIESFKLRGFPPSEHEKAAVSATSAALVGNWVPMKDFLGMEVTVGQLAIAQFGVQGEGVVVTALRNLKDSL